MGFSAHGFLASIAKARLLVVVLVFSLTVGALAILRFFTQKPANPQPGAAVISRETTQSVKLAEADRDSDGDGLKDWEEKLYGTAVDNADTDGDGTSDADEITQSRDPLKRGPKDKMSQPTTDSRLPDQNDLEKNNLTYGLAKSLAESGVFSAIDESGEVRSNDFLKRLSLPQNADPDVLLSQAAVMTVKDLHINPDNSPATVKKYFNALYDIFAKHITPVQTRSDVAILIEALENNDYSKLADLDPIIRALERTVAEVKKVPVPSDYQNLVVTELNYILETKRAAEIFRNTASDPIATAIIARRRIDIFRELALTHQKIKTLLTSKGVSFDPSEGGYVYLQ